MTLFELAFVAVMLLLGLVGTALARALGVPHVASLGLGLAATCALPIVVALGVLVDERFVSGPPGLPPCPACAVEPAWREGSRGWVRRCACGVRFERRGGRVWRVGSDGAHRLHARWRWRRGWVPEPGGDGGDPYR